MNVTPINKSIGFRMQFLTINQDGSLVCKYTVGTLGEDGSYKPIAEKDYVLSEAEAAPILSTEGQDGASIFDQLQDALGAALSARPDWLA